jgi:hypothetical protein
MITSTLFRCMLLSHTRFLVVEKVELCNLDVVHYFAYQVPQQHKHSTIHRNEPKYNYSLYIYKNFNMLVLSFYDKFMIRIF